MQITHVEVVPVEFKLRLPYRTAHLAQVDHAAAVFIRVETRQGGEHGLLDESCHDETERTSSQRHGVWRGCYSR